MSGPDPRPFLDGRLVVLRPLEETDVNGPYPAWFNDAEVCRFNSHHVFPLTRSAARDYVRAVASDRSTLVLAIELKASGAHVGNVSLQQIDWFHRTADFAILVGDRSVWGTGAATEAGTLLIEHGFGQLGLRRITAATLAENTAMRRLAARLGMREEGVRREALFKSGSFHDVVEFGVLVGDTLEKE